MTRRRRREHRGRWIVLPDGTKVRRTVDDDGNLVAEEWMAPVIDLTGDNDSKLHPARRRSR